MPHRRVRHYVVPQVTIGKHGAWIGMALVACMLPAIAGTPPVGWQLPPPGAPASAYGPTFRNGPDGHPDADDLAALAKQQLALGNLENALQIVLRVRAYAPRNAQAIKTEVLALSDLGAAHRASDLAYANASLFSEKTLQRLRVHKTTEDIIWALDDRKRVDQRNLFRHRDQLLNGSLDEIHADLAALPKGSSAHWRTQDNRVKVLQELGRNQEALDVFRALKQEKATIPPYVLRFAANAELELQHPERAAVLYRTIVTANPKADVDIFISYYYALIESEDYDAAEKILENIYKVTPVWLDFGPHIPHEVNWERLDVDQLWTLDPAYRQNLALGEKRSKDLYDRAPANDGLINGYAAMLRWRGWPLAAKRITARAAAYAAKSRETRLNVAANARDLGHFARWRDTVAGLAKDFPRDIQIHKSVEALDDRNHPSMSTDWTLGHSNGGNTVHGDRDRQLVSRYNSSWSAHGWRTYAWQGYRWANIYGRPVSFNRAGGGLERVWDRRHLWARLSGDTAGGRHPGLQLGWSQWLNDHWQYEIQADSYSEQTPLRAERAGLHGRLVDTQVSWRASESRSASIGGSVLDISDGNRRTSLSAAFNQRIQASPHHLTRLSLLLSSTHDSQPGGPYFNPRDLHSVGFHVRHEWITWRRYERTLTQVFSITGASEFQSRYGNHDGFELEYGNTWELSRTWSLRYGIGWGSHVYDGAREQRLFGVFAMSGVF